MKAPIFIVLLCQIFLTGCVGLAVSIPGPTQIQHIPNDGANFADESYLPREKESQEEVIRDLDNKEIRYETGWKRRCLTFLVALPLAHGDCSRIETWSYEDSNQITIKSHSHRLIGLWCSPIPYAAAIPLFDMGPSYMMSTKYFPFCEIHLGTELYVTSYTF